MAPRPTVSAVLIVKDEEPVVEHCLASVRWVDEVVVYDTGSTDGTVAAARRHADVVVEGYWDDDFAGARNRALEHASGDWVLTIDADEVFEGDPDVVRRSLDAEEATLRTLLITDGRPVSVGPSSDFPSVRLHRRAQYRWRGRLHEQLVDPRTGRVDASQVSALPGARLLHSGYRSDVVAAKDKGARNVGMAERSLAAALAEGDAPAAVVELRADLARSLAMAGRLGEALEAAEGVIADPLLHRATADTLCRAMTWAAEESGDVPATETWLERWRAVAPHPAWPWAETARSRVRRGDHAGALSALEHVPATSVSAAGLRLERVDLARVEVNALAGTARWEDAVACATRAARAGRLPGDPADLQLVFERAGRPVDALLRALPEGVWKDCALLAGHDPEPRALLLLEAMRDLRPGDVAVLTCAAAAAGAMTIQEAMEWSLAARQAGLPQLCPLRAIASAPGADPRQRAVAAAVVWEAYEESDVLTHLQDALAQVPADQEAQLLELLEAAAPGLVSTGA